MPELVIMIGLPGAGKTSFHRARFAPTHVHVSKDLMRNRRDRQQRQLALIDEALAAGRSVVVDNLNVTAGDRAALIGAARRRRASVIGYVFSTDVGESIRRNRGRAGRERVPVVAIHTAAKRFQPPAQDEGFDRLERVRAEAGGFEISPYDGEPEDPAVFVNPDSALAVRRRVSETERSS